MYLYKKVFMKKILLLALLFPLLSFGQRFEISEMGGYSNDLANTFFQKNAGYSNQVSFNYYFTKCFSMGAYHELDAWKPYTNSGGLMADIHFKHFYCGVSFAALFINATTFRPSLFELSGPSLPWSGAPPPVVKSNPVMSLGAHLGIDQKVAKHFFVKEQIGYNTANTKALDFDEFYTAKIHSLSALAGISYRF
jgi:hypothetical protein